MTNPRMKTETDFIADGHTPMMAQYHAVKAAHPDCLLFYRMGDFFELFFEDALIASSVLDITLTHRGKNQGDDIPMCGVPFHSHEPYLARLIRAGHKVAICEQTESPEDAKKRGGKSLVRREVVRIVTAGTLTEDNLLDARTNNYLASISEVGEQFALAWADVSTGEFLVQPITKTQLSSTLQRISPKEILAPEDDSISNALLEFRDCLSQQSPLYFESERGRARLQSLFGVETIESFGAFSRAEISAAGALIDYIERTQKGNLPHLSRPKKTSSDDVLEIDPSTLRNLELVRTLSGEKRGSLLSTIDRTLTGAGARMLQSRLVAPLRNLKDIEQRHNEIEYFIQSRSASETICSLLKSIPDMERALARLSMKRGGPRDLVALREGLTGAASVRTILIENGACETALRPFCDALSETPDLAQIRDKLSIALTDSPPVLTRDGGFIRAGFSEELDRLRGLRDESRRMIAGLQSHYSQMTGIETLKITHNNILGYFIEVPAKRSDALLVKNSQSENPFIHRQTMAGAVRFTTPELASFEKDISSAADKSLALELAFFETLSLETLALADIISQQAAALAAIDVASAQANLAIEQNYIRPVVDSSLAFHIEEGRHPVVESALRSGSEIFSPNDCDLSDVQRIWLLTGPNMAGKSTFLRQNALIVIMAQAGFFVPATSAHIGMVDKVFSRVGAADDLARGRSTFMIEMVETATILNQSTSRSLVILDEIGRGTSTFDGLSIAWACLEYLHNILKCRGLFATHYHELTTLQETLPHLSCARMEVREWKGDVIFLHSVSKGTADRSYGIHVAQLAGLPPAVTNRARDILALLEKGERASSLANLAQDLPLFNSQSFSRPIGPSEVEKSLREINPDSLSPREALETLYKLKNLLKNP